MIGKSIARVFLHREYRICHCHDFVSQNRLVSSFQFIGFSFSAKQPLSFAYQSRKLSIEQHLRKELDKELVKDF
ncbi:MAG TPA: hypothetical protein DCM62_04450 [Bacteroidales bacterium]|nr:hypothetical protein [Bacteroidales bacterium]